MDDQFSAFSLYVDPVTTSSDRLKPEVVAVGQRVNSTIPQSPWIGPEVQGTSFAAPIVAGQAALMMQRREWLTSYEIVEFQAPVTGTYRARIHLSRWDDSSMIEVVGTFGTPELSSNH